MEKLVEFSKAEGQDDLYSYCHRVRRTTFEVFQDFGSVLMPLNYLIDLVPLMKARRFSISSSPLVHQKQVHLTVAIVEYKTRLKSPRKGVCTEWMAGLKPGDKIHGIIQEGLIKMDTNPAICIGPGTGIAPMRSILHSKTKLQNMLFCGNRNKEHDFLYGDEWAQMPQLLTFTAFSRDQPEKVYVQDRIIEQHEQVYKMIESNATIYLSGNAKKMPQDVEQALILVFTKHGLNIKQAEAKLDELKRARRFQIECYS